MTQTLEHLPVTAVTARTAFLGQRGWVTTSWMPIIPGETEVQIAKLRPPKRRANRSSRMRPPFLDVFCSLSQAVYACIVVHTQSPARDKNDVLFMPACRAGIPDVYMPLRSSWCPGLRTVVFPHCREAVRKGLTGFLFLM